MRMLGCLKILSLSLGLTVASNAAGGDVNYSLGSYTFEVPKENIPDLSPWGWLRSLAGLDQEVDSFVFEFAGSEVDSAVEGYSLADESKEQKLVGAVYLIDDKERAELSDPSKLSDIWHARNGFEDREVVLDEHSGFYFVYERRGYRGMFYVFSKPPEARLPGKREDFFVAVCSGSSTTELKHVSCSSKFLLDPDLMVDFSVPLGKLKLQPQVRAFLADTLSEWMQ
jgi:hypothetical protein